MLQEEMKTRGRRLTRMMTCGIRHERPYSPEFYWGKLPKNQEKRLIKQEINEEMQLACYFK